MRVRHGSEAAVPRELLERRKRAFMAALTLRGDTQSSWAARHKIDQGEVSRTLSGRGHSARVLGLIYLEIERTSDRRVTEGVL